MARTAIKSTYSLDVETVQQLEAMAERLGVSKSEALRRAIRATAKDVIDHKSEALLALDELQGRLKLSPSSAKNWAEMVKAERTVFATARTLPDS